LLRCVSTWTPSTRKIGRPAGWMPRHIIGCDWHQHQLIRPGGVTGQRGKDKRALEKLASNRQHR
jgi:hypothetical protein